MKVASEAILACSLIALVLVVGVLVLLSMRWTMSTLLVLSRKRKYGGTLKCNPMYFDQARPEQGGSKCLALAFAFSATSELKFRNEEIKIGAIITDRPATLAYEQLLPRYMYC